MNEHERHQIPEARSAPERDIPDWRRLDVARDRYQDRVAAGIDRAQSEHSEIDDDTARCIAHVLGRALGRDSNLAEFGRTGEGQYLSLRDEYLDLYRSDEADPVTKEWIDWFGTYLVQREQTGTGRRYMNEHLPPKLDQLLVHTRVRIGDEQFLVNVPASWHSGNEDDLVELLTTLRLPEDEALQAFLALPDVSAGVDDIMEAFHDSFVATFTSPEDAVHGLCEIDEWETEVREFAGERGLLIDAVSVDYAMLLERLDDAYDLAEWKEHVHVFYK